MFNFFTESIENGTDADIIYLDFAKAFDSLPQNGLICKLHNHGIRSNLFLWIKNFLSHRRKQIQVSPALSNWENVTSGVPKVSIFTPVLLIIYINYLPYLRCYFFCSPMMQN